MVIDVFFVIEEAVAHHIIVIADTLSFLCK